MRQLPVHCTGFSDFYTGHLNFGSGRAYIFGSLPTRISLDVIRNAQPHTFADTLVYPRGTGKRRMGTDYGIDTGIGFKSIFAVARTVGVWACSGFHRVVLRILPACAVRAY